MTPDHFDFRAALREERSRDKQLAKMLADAFAGDDPEKLLQAIDQMEYAVDGWRLALARVGRLGEVSPEVSAAFLNVWIQMKHLPLEVGHRPTMAKALRVLLSPLRPAVSESMKLYRGASARERRSRLYGFSWSQDVNIAESFAEAKRSIGAVVMETLATPEAVLLIREPEGFYDEGEVIVDPYRLGAVRVIGRLT